MDGAFDMRVTGELQRSRIVARGRHGELVYRKDVQRIQGDNGQEMMDNYGNRRQVSMGTDMVCTLREAWDG